MTPSQKALITRVVRATAGNRTVKDGWISGSRLAAYHLDTHRSYRLRDVPRQEIIDYAASKGAHRATLNIEMDEVVA